MTPLIKVICGILIIAYMGLFAFGWLTGTKSVFPMPPSSYQRVEPDWLKIVHDGSGGSVLAQVLEAEDAKGYILFHHGNGEDLGSIQERLRLLRDMGWTVLAWEYPGYGLSPGTADEESVMTAAYAVADYCRDVLGWPEEKTVQYGRSLGGGPSVLLASQRPYRGTILEGTFTSTFRVVTGIRLLPFDIFDNLALIGKLQGPVLIVHGTEDLVVPFSHGPKLYAAAPGPKRYLWIEGGQHNDLPTVHQAAYVEAVKSFLDSL